MADEVATLKRELEELKLQLEQERKKNTTVQRESGPNTKQEPKPERGSSQGDQSIKSRRRFDDNKAAPSSPLKASRIYGQHAAVGSRHGKWWLRERQVLSRATADEDGAETLKVRETWVWSGRTVILDKIVRLDEKQGEEPLEEVDQAKPPELENDASEVSLASPVKGLEGAAQPSKTAETSEAESSTAGQEVVDSNVVAELSMSPVPAKADDEVRESSAPAEPQPVVKAS
ncbi:hypothetical protein V7S43_007566 [Phytophthora oleae]|uniref:Uncharacterized protein n=1 Tax=Phytophthora oleae TaxID=2107226 RepID=A0ABD3FQQ5_9STRA